MTAILCLALLGQAAPAQPAPRLVIKGQGTALGETPIVVPITAPIEPGTHYGLLDGGRLVARAAIFRDGGTTYLASILPRVPAEGELSLVLQKQIFGALLEEGVAYLPSEDGVRFLLHDRPLADYHAPQGLKPYFFPLIGPGERRFTRAFPMEDVPGEKRDHPHQRSLWFTHGKVNGIDFWSEEKGHGSIRETSRTLVRSVFVLARLRTTDDWVAPDGKVVCSDERTVTFYDTPNSRIIDFDVTIKASHGPVTFGDTKEAMFGVRVATSMDVASKKGGKITNSDGLTDEAAWGKPASWVDYTGPVDGETVGIAILNHPSSFRYPTTWHVRTYGLFAANPFGWRDFGRKESGEYTVPAGESIRFAYRVILHKGDTAAADIPSAFASYAKPPSIEVKVD